MIILMMTSLLWILRVQSPAKGLVMLCYMYWVGNK